MGESMLIMFFFYEAETDPGSYSITLNSGSLCLNLQVKNRTATSIIRPGG